MQGFSSFLVGGLVTGAMLAFSQTEEKSPLFPPLPVFISSLMAECRGPGGSEASRSTLARQMEEAATRHLRGLHQHQFIALLCLETRMGGIVKAKSSAGALGVAQLMEGTAKAEALRCGLGVIERDDLFDNAISLDIAACHYAALIEQHGPEIAPWAYNAGGNAEAVKKAKRLLPSGNLETANYAALHALIMARFLNVSK